MPTSSLALILFLIFMVEVMRSEGADIIDANFTLPNGWNDITDMPTIDFGSVQPKYLKELKSNPNNITNLEDIRRFTRESPAENYPTFNVTLWNDFLDNIQYDNMDPRFTTLHDKITAEGKNIGLQKALEQHNLSSVVVPTSIAPMFLAYNGAPAVSLPVGYYPESAESKLSPSLGNLTDTGPGVPIGIGFMGRPWSEQKLIGQAYALEQLTGARDKAVRKSLGSPGRKCLPLCSVNWRRSPVKSE